MTDAPKYLICKYGGYYKPNSQGYTGSAITAGRYTLRDAVAITHPNGENGPRDGMRYIHEDDITVDDWIAHKKILDARDATIAELVEALERVTNELEDEVAANYPPHLIAYPHNQQKLANDMESVNQARATLNRLTARVEKESE